MAKLVIEVEADDLDKANRKLKIIGKTGQEVEADIKSFGDSTEKAGGKANKSFSRMATYAAATAASIALIKRVTETSIKVQANFEQSIADLSAITGATGDDLAYFSSEAQRMGATTKFSASEAAEAFKLIASAKPDLLDNASAMSQVTEQVLTLAAASGTTLTDAATTVGSALNQFGADASSAARFVNVLAAGSKYGASEVTDTAEALKNAGVSAAGAKVSFEETNAAIQVLSANAIKGGEAGTALRNIILKLETSANKKLHPSIVGLSGALRELNKTQPTATDLVGMFGLENVNAATAILKNADSLEQMTNKLTGTNVALEQASTRSNTLEGDFKALQSATEALEIAIGTNLNPATRAITQELTSAAQSAAFFYNSLVEGSQQNITSRMADISDEIKNLQKDVEDNESAWGRFNNVLTFTSTDSDTLKKKISSLREEYSSLQQQLIKQSGLTLPEQTQKSTISIDTTTNDTSSSVTELTDKQQKAEDKRLDVIRKSVATEGEIRKQQLDENIKFIEQSSLSEQDQADLLVDVWANYYDEVAADQKKLTEKRKEEQKEQLTSLRDSLLGENTARTDNYEENKKLIEQSVTDAEERYLLLSKLDEKFNEDIKAHAEETFRDSSEYANTFMDTLDSLGSQGGSILKGLATGTSSLKDAFASVGDIVLDEVFKALAQAGIQMVKNEVLAQSLTATQVAGTQTVAAANVAATTTTTAATTAAAAETTAASAPAAALTSTFSFGGAAIAGAAALASIMLLANSFRAQGGQVNSGSSYLVGERGPELFTPGTSGSITSNAQMNKSSGGGNVYVTNNNSGSNQVSASTDSDGNTYVTIDQLDSLMAVHGSNADSKFNRQRRKAGFNNRRS